MAKIVDIGVYLPSKVLDNDELAKVFPSWPADKIYSKTGIRERKIAAEDETASDMGVNAAENLFKQGLIKRDVIDFLIFCSQAPDYILPATACLIQEALRLPTSCGAMDISLGCSGFVYSLSVANGLIESGAAKNVLLITSDTYSKYINPRDKSVRTLFGDAAAATLVSSGAKSEKIGPFVFGTDGSGAENLIVSAGMFRNPINPSNLIEVMDASGNYRSKGDLHMNGPEIMLFSLQAVPAAIQTLCEKSNNTIADFDMFVFHQANSFILNALAKKLKIPLDKMPIYLKVTGNTVSSTIPIVLDHLIKSNQILKGKKILLCGFGVGYSWAACQVIF